MVNAEIDISLVCDYMEKEFGYKSIQVAVINRVLARGASSKVQKDYRNIEKKNRQFILVKSLLPLIDDFSTKMVDYLKKTLIYRHTSRISS